jgi:pimeloyl-ACP methyl ester carboxylesterase
LIAARGERWDNLENRPAGKRRVGPASERRESVETHSRSRLEHESSAGVRLTCCEGSAKSASLRPPMPRLIRARSASGVTKSEPSVSDGQPQVFIVGNAPNQRRIAFRRRAPVRSESPGLVWLSGYRSDMDSTKASALDAEAERRGLGLLRFDYSGHGRSDGRLQDGTISRWLEETLALIRAQSEGPQIVVGSSMGGYLALLAIRALSKAGEAERVKGLILIAPAVDMTEALIWAKAPDEARRAIMQEGVWRRPSAYSSEPDCFTRDLIEDGRKHLLLGGMIRTGAPTAVLQGMRDEDVPFSHALALMQRFGGDPATLTLVKDGDHRLSRPQDLQLVFDALERML